MDVLSYEQEYQLLSSKCTVNQETLLKLCDIIKDIRKEVKSDTPRISTTISTRVTLEIVELLTDAFTLEQAIEFIEDDELVEVTPNSIRLRKKGRVRT